MAYDFLQVKRCSLPVSRDFVAASLKDHEEALTTVRKPAREAVPWDVLFDSINRTVDEVIPRKTRLNAKVYRPSPSAHTVKMGSELLSRRESGALGFFSKRLPLGQELWSMREVRPGKVVSVYVPVVEDDISSEFAENLDILQDEPNVAVPIALCEPFKVRVITLGSARHYWAARTLQRKIHRLMRRHWTFQLIGRPCRDEDLINQLLGKARPDDYVNSGDYKASTDNLDPDVSDAVMGRICENLGMPYYSWIRDSLTRHVLEYETREALVDCGSLRVRQGPRRRRKQAWGQLMGSPLSFVVLCLANAAASRIPLERYYRKTRLSDLPMLVNGDDIISCGDLPTIERWKQIVTQIGLQPSVGKSYVSKKFCMINSELYELPYRVDWFGCRERKAIFRPYANLGLVFGQGRVQTDSQLLVGDDDARDLSVVSHELIDGQDDLRAEILLSEFLYAHNTELRNNLPKGMNWFVPKCYGGAGLATLHQFQISKQQAKFAALMRSDPQFRLALRRVLPSTALTPSMEYSARLARELEVPLVEGGETIPRTGLESLIWPLDSSKYDPSEKDFLMGYERLRKKSLRTSLKPMSLDKVMEGNKSEIIGFDVMRCFVTKTNPQVLG